LTQPRPWYYQSWFLIAAFLMGWPLPYFFLLWPVWSVLIIRSPWHRGFLFRVLAWAMLFSGVVLVARWLFQGEVATYGVLASIVPGLVVTGFTQFHWTRHKGRVEIETKRELLAVGRESTLSSGLHTPTYQDPTPRSSRERLRRRRLMRRLSRPGRRSRHPF
jgi:hypothetical protein